MISQHGIKKAEESKGGNDLVWVFLMTMLIKGVVVYQLAIRDQNKQQKQTNQPV